ncbi:MAG TPA: flagellar filament capping protein FliD [Candidatus Hydrogenedentes bacterium]|nr:flagellar filament capping protein FliD [Candidatus Hydrogenedentota bacterium]HOK89038.1 flagellar filament capping protein FliD [Candidatus Hydrogenedentota bacterium]
MAGGITASGLITGIDSNALINQLMQLERQPITRLQNQITTLNTQRTALTNLTNTLRTLRSRAQDFRLLDPFNKFNSSSGDEDVLTTSITGSSPTVGTYSVQVIQLATATTAVSGGRVSADIDPNVALENSGISTGITGGTFSINGVDFTVDPTTDSLNDILNAINSSSAGVTATYDASADRVVIANTTPGNTAVITLGRASDTSNFLSAIGVRGATQYTNTNGSTEVRSTTVVGAVNTLDKLDEANLRNGPVTAGTFSINGISISVDPTTDALADVLSRINSSDAGVVASYDPINDTIRLQSKLLGSRNINIGSTGDTSNFLSVFALDTAVQTTGNDAQIAIDGGPTLTRNTNAISDAINGVTLNLKDTGTVTVTVSPDEDAAISAVKAFIDQYNTAISDLRNQTAVNGTLQGDGGLRSIQGTLQGMLFSTVPGNNPAYTNLVDIGFNTGSTFNSQEYQPVQLDEEKFRKALREAPTTVKALFTNNDKTGIGDLFEDYLNGATSTTGFLSERTRTNGAIDRQIAAINERIRAMEERLTQRENRLRQSFTRLEQISAQLRSQNAALSRFGSGVF